VEAQLFTSLKTSLTNIKFINFDKCTFYSDEYNNSSLDLTGIEYLIKFELDISDLGFEYCQYVFFLIEYTNKHDEKASIYYKYQANELADAKPFQLDNTTLKFINDHGCFKSLESVAYKIKFSRIKTFSIYHSSHRATARVYIQLMH
jgi:hypothetical protein